jgi:hypothetical protein
MNKRDMYKRITKSSFALFTVPVFKNNVLARKFTRKMHTGLIMHNSQVVRFFI